MMWREFQLHSITFSMRSLVVMAFLWTGQNGLHRYRGVVVLAAHLVADEISRRYKQARLAPTSLSSLNPKP